MNKITYLFNKTKSELLVSIVHFIDFLLPDLTLFTPLRSLFYKLIADIGVGTRFKKGQYLSLSGKLTIGKNCYLNRSNLFDLNEKIVIGNNCSIGYRNCFITSSHYEKGTGFDDIKFTTKQDPILIGNNVWITTGCTILPGVKIGDNCIIAAGAIVSKNCDAGYIYGGVPAKKIRETKGFVCKKN